MAANTEEEVQLAGNGVAAFALVVAVIDAMEKASPGTKGPIIAQARAALQAGQQSPSTFTKFSYNYAAGLLSQV